MSNRKLPFPWRTGSNEKHIGKHVIYAADYQIVAVFEPDDFNTANTICNAVNVRDAIRNMVGVRP